MTEIFIDIKGYENLYQVSNFGNIKSLAKGDGNGCRDRILKFDIIGKSTTRYYRVSLSKDGKVSRYSVHRLVAKHFINNTDNKPMVNHIDNDGTNNKVTNLEWCTHSENMIHAQKQGRLLSSQRNAALAANKVIVARNTEKFNNMIGTKVGKLTITGFFICNTGVNKRTKLICLCDCGEKLEVLPYNLNNKLLMCRKCKYKQRAVTRKEC